jgi:hypothetical protein
VKRIHVAGWMVAAGLWVGGCSNPGQVQPPTVTPPSEIGRFQVVVAREADGGSVLFLLDTKDGATWIYRPPQGPAINGFWSDIPRLTYAPDYWQRAFTQQPEQPGQTGGQPAVTPPTQGPLAPSVR